MHKEKKIRICMYVNTCIYLYYMQIYEPVNLRDNFKHIHRCTHMSACMHASWPHCPFRLSSPPCTLFSISPPPNSKYNTKNLGTGHFKIIFVLCWLYLSCLYILISTVHYLSLLYTLPPPL